MISHNRDRNVKILSLLVPFCFLHVQEQLATRRSMMQSTPPVGPLSLRIAIGLPSEKNRCINQSVPYRTIKSPPFDRSRSGWKCEVSTASQGSAEPQQKLFFRPRPDDNNLGRSISHILRKLKRLPALKTASIHLHGTAAARPALCDWPASIVQAASATRLQRLQAPIEQSHPRDNCQTTLTSSESQRTAAPRRELGPLPLAATNNTQGAVAHWHLRNQPPCLGAVRIELRYITAFAVHPPGVS